MSTAKSKYNTTYFQWGGKGSTADRYAKFTAPEQGTLKVWVMVTVNVGGDEQSVAGGYNVNDGAKEVEFSIPAGEVLIYCTGNALRFYRIYYTNK